MCAVTQHAPQFSSAAVGLRCAQTESANGKYGGVAHLTQPTVVDWSSKGIVCDDVIILVTE